MPSQSDPPCSSPPPVADTSRKPQVRTTGGFALVLEIADPSRFGELRREIEKRQIDIEEALESLHYVHFARFLPLPKQRPTQLIVISEYDGADDAYILDFAAVMGDVFDAILGFVKDPPPLPVSKHPYAFLNFVRKHDVPERPWSAYRDCTVLELLQGQSRTTMPRQAPKPKDSAPTSIADADVQGNLLRSYHAKLGYHFALRIVEPAKARAFLGGVTGDDPDWLQVSSARDASDPNAKCFLNIGLTFSGLRMLGVPETALDAFPQAFREGPAHGARAADIGDTGKNAPEHWLLGSPDKPVDLLVSFWSK